MTDESKEYRGQQDGELVRKSLEGDNEAFAELVGRHYKMFYSLVLGYLHNLAKAEEVVQDGLIEIHKCLRQLQEPEKFRAWGYTIIRRKAIRALRLITKEEQAMQKYLEIESIKIAHERALKRQAEMPDSTREERILNAISQLPRKYREIMVLYFLEEIEIEEVAEKLRITERTAIVRLYRAKKKIRDILEEGK